MKSVGVFKIQSITEHKSVKGSEKKTGGIIRTSLDEIIGDPGLRGTGDNQGCGETSR
jgi:hypothetical protein